MHWGFMGWKPRQEVGPYYPLIPDPRDTRKIYVAISILQHVIPMNGFYEWSGAKEIKPPLYTSIQ